MLALELMRISKNDDKTMTAYNKMITQFSKKVEKYDTEKKESMENAKQKESIRNEVQKHTKTFGEALIF